MLKLLHESKQSLDISAAWPAAAHGTRHTPELLALQRQRIGWSSPGCTPRHAAFVSDPPPPHAGVGRAYRSKPSSSGQEAFTLLPKEPTTRHPACV